MADTSLVFNILAKDKASKTFDKLKGTALVAGAAIGAALGAGLAQAFEQEKALDKLEAQLGGAWTKDAGQAAANLYANGWADSAGQAGDAIRAAMQGGLVEAGASGQAIEDLTGKAMALSQTFDQDVSATVRAASQLVRTGLAANSEEALNILTRGFQSTGDLAGDLLDTYSEYGTQFRKLGLDGATATGLMAQGLKAGARDVDTVADTLKEFSIRAIDGSKTTKAGFEALGLSAEDMAAQIAQGGPNAAGALAHVLAKLREMKDPTAQSAAAVALFGTKAEDMGEALYSLDLKTAVDELGGVEGAAGDLADTLHDNAATQLESFKRQAQQALVTQLAKAVPYLRTAGEWLVKHKAVVGPLAIALGTFATIIGTIIAVTKVWAVVQTAMNIIMTANPIGLIIVGIAALIAIIVLIATKTTWFQDAWAWAWGGIKAAAGAVWGWIKGTLWPGIKKVFEWIANVFTWPARTLVKHWDGIVSWFKSFPGKIRNALVGVSSILTAPFRAAFNGIARLWNRGPGQLSFSTPSWVPFGLGGKGFSMPKLPILHQGGIVPGRPGQEVLALLQAGEQVTPARQVQSSVVSRSRPAQPVQINIYGDLKGAIRKIVRTDGRGSVVTAFERG